MTCLIIDTSTDLCLIAAARGPDILCEQVFAHGNLLSKNLLPSIQEMLAKANIPLSALTFIAAGIGPGSYTGTRLGASVAKSLAFGLNIPVKPFHSPLAFLPHKEGSFAFLLPTRAGGFFVLKGCKKPSRIVQESAGLLSVEQLFFEIHSADFLICPTSLHLPDALHQKPRIEPLPNFSALALFLETVAELSPENIAMQYLHTPS